MHAHAAVCLQRLALEAGHTARDAEHLAEERQQMEAAVLSQTAGEGERQAALDMQRFALEAEVRDLLFPCF